MRQWQKLLTYAGNSCAEAEEINFSGYKWELEDQVKGTNWQSAGSQFQIKNGAFRNTAKLDLDGYQLVDHDFD